MLSSASLRIFVIACFAAAACLGQFANLAPAFAASAEVNSKVPPGKWKGVRLKNLPQGAGLSIKVAANGSLAVILVHEAELERYPEQRVRPAFQGTLERKLSFSVVIPEPGNYYVILDNRLGSKEREVRVQIQARRPESKTGESASGKDREQQI